MRYELLGPLRVIDDQRPSFIGARKVEVLLAVLLARVDQIVPIDQLIDEIWGERRPRRATEGIHVYISQLRKFLTRPGRQASPIVTRPSGYLLHLGEDELDYFSFQRLVDVGRDHMRSAHYAEATQCFETALGLWRGLVLSDMCDGPILGGFAALATEARLECFEMLAEAKLELGRHRELIGLLYSLVADNPLREGFYRQLMLALYRSERQAEALEVFQSARRVLNDELGLEPCRSLQELQQSILVADDRLLHAAG